MKTVNKFAIGALVGLMPVLAWSTDYYYVTHKATGMKLNTCGPANGTEIGVVSEDTTDTCTQWERVEANGYFYLKSRAGDGYIRPRGLSNDVPIKLHPTDWDGAYTQWTYEDSGDDYGYLVNRQTKKLIFSDGEKVTQGSKKWLGDWTRWKFEAVDDTSEPPLVDVDVSIEAEDGVLTGSAQVYTDGAASGGEGVAYLGTLGAGVTFENLQAAQSLTITYASVNSGTLSVLINGQDSGQNLSFQSTGGWTGTYQTTSVEVTIPEGASVSISNQQGDAAANIDKIVFSGKGVAPTDPGTDPGDGDGTGAGNGDITNTGKVTLTKGEFVWDTYGYQMNPDFSLANWDHSPSSITSKTYETWILENDYIKVTVLPSFGGRILSLFNKATGHEELYQNPVGTPYLVYSNIFYYDWLMIMGGIFPTFPEPEHGKSWNREWDFEIITQNDDEVTVAMSYTDTDGFDRAPGRYARGFTNMTCTYTVTLKANRSAVDAEVKLVNPQNNDVYYEYWTDTTLSPGSDPKDPKATTGFEMIAPIQSVFHEYGIGPTNWDGIKWYKNHTGEGIAYASPNLAGTNFWGAINHDNEEGIFRIADNSKTPGLKIWTFGFYDDSTLDPYANGVQWHRPAIELWAGVTDRFFQKKRFPANSTETIPETYSPSVGMENVTHANERVLANLSADGVELYFLDYDRFYTVEIQKNGSKVFDKTLAPEALGSWIKGDYGSNTVLTISENGQTIFTASN